MSAAHRGHRYAAGVLVAVAALSGGCSGEDSLADRMPADGQIGSWVKAGPVTVADTDTKLYNLIDGAAPKYIDRGWQASAYATYTDDSMTLQAAVHDMGAAAAAQEIFEVDLPVARVDISGGKAVVDLGLPDAYRGTGWGGRYFVEVAVDARTDAALAYVKTFTLAVLGN